MSAVEMKFNFYICRSIKINFFPRMIQTVCRVSADAVCCNRHTYALRRGNACVSRKFEQCAHSGSDLVYDNNEKKNKGNWKSAKP